MDWWNATEWMDRCNRMEQCNRAGSDFQFDWFIWINLTLSEQTRFYFSWNIYYIFRIITYHCTSMFIYAYIFIFYSLLTHSFIHWFMYSFIHIKVYNPSDAIWLIWFWFSRMNSVAGMYSIRRYVLHPIRSDAIWLIWFWFDSISIQSVAGMY